MRYGVEMSKQDKPLPTLTIVAPGDTQLLCDIAEHVTNVQDFWDDHKRIEPPLYRHVKQQVGMEWMTLKFMEGFGPIGDNVVFAVNVNEEKTKCEGVIAYHQVIPGWRATVNVMFWRNPETSWHTPALVHLTGKAMVKAKNLLAVDTFIRPGNVRSQASVLAAGMKFRGIMKGVGRYNGVVENLHWYEGDLRDLEKYENGRIKQQTTAAPTGIRVSGTSAPGPGGTDESAVQPDLRGGQHPVGGSGTDGSAAAGAASASSSGSGRTRRTVKRGVPPRSGYRLRS